MSHIDYRSCQKEFKHLDSKIVLPTDGDEYHEGLKRWSDAAVRPAAAIAFPCSDEDVATTVKFARRHNVEVAVSGGRHSTGGSSSCENGLVIDMSRMKRVVVDPKACTATAQGGALWADVDRETIKHGLACVGGTVNHTGVGGLTLGGGYGWLSGHYGMVVDNLLWVRMVLSDGRIVTVSETEHADLFWAVRGAGSCFGVAVEFCYKAHPAPKHVCAGIIGFPMEKLDEVIDALNHFRDHHFDKNCSFLFNMAHPPPHRVPVIGVMPVILNHTKLEAELKLARLFALGPVLNLFREVPYVEMNAQLNAITEHGTRRLLHGSTDAPPLKKTLFYQVRDHYVRFVRENKNVEDCAVAWEMLHTDKMCEVPLTATAATMRFNTFNVVLVGRWFDEAQDEIVRKWAREAGAMIKEGGFPKNELLAYPNALGRGHRMREVFGENLPRLVETKKKYDDCNMFRSWHNLLAE